MLARKIRFELACFGIEIAIPAAKRNRRELPEFVKHPRIAENRAGLGCCVLAGRHGSGTSLGLAPAFLHAPIP